MVLGDVGRMLLIGLVVGTIGVLFTARWIASLLYRLQATDVTTLALAVGVLVAASTMAAALPARRAARIDPSETLRDS